MTEQFRAIESPQYVPYQQEMTLRDYFASEAMNGICLNTRDTVELDNKSTAKCIAKLAYEIADAMLEARKQ